MVAKPAANCSTAQAPVASDNSKTPPSELRVPPQDSPPSAESTLEIKLTEDSLSSRLSLLW